MSRCPQDGEQTPIDLDVECCKHGLLWEDPLLMSFEFVWLNDGQCICYSKSIHPLPSDAIWFFSVELGEYPQQDQQDAYIYLTNKCVCVCISQIEKAGMLSTKISEFLFGTSAK